MSTAVTSIIDTHPAPPIVIPPAGFELSSTWQIASGEWRSSLRRTGTKAEQTEEPRTDLPALYAAARSRKPRPLRPTRLKDVGKAVLFTDLQAGKTDHRGGTVELIQRMAEKRELLDEQITRDRPSSLALLDGGDGIESFAQTAGQAFTNDLSLMDQIDVYATELYETIRMMARHGVPVTVAGVPSNHAAWRSGKQALGKPSDDWGLHVHKQVEKITQAQGLDVAFVKPADQYSESLAFDFAGHRLGLTHGHQAGPGKFGDWFAKQAHGGGPLFDADVVATGHYHCPAYGLIGRLPNGWQRHHLQGPTLDNGSAWYRNSSGGTDSDPGLMTFDVRPGIQFDIGAVGML
jgi:hypothetical protein